MLLFMFFQKPASYTDQLVLPEEEDTYSLK